MKYKELLEMLNGLSESELEQEVQFVPPDPDHDKTVPLGAVVCFLKVKDLDQNTRSSYDNKHHLNDWVLYVDVNLFAEDGTMGFDLLTGERF